MVHYKVLCGGEHNINEDVKKLHTVALYSNPIKNLCPLREKEGERGGQRERERSGEREREREVTRERVGEREN